MSVLVNGMEMPKECNECRMRSESNIFCNAMPANFCGYISDDGKPDWCPLMEVPKHGRLIDADEMFVSFVMEGQRSRRYKLGEKWELNGEEIRKVIAELPTVIPASGKDEMLEQLQTEDCTEILNLLKRCSEFSCRGCKYEFVMGCRALLSKKASEAIESLINASSHPGKQGRNMNVIWANKEEI